MVRLVFFGKLMDVAGTGQETIDLPSSVNTVAALKAWLVTRESRWKSAFERATDLTVTVDKRFADDTTAVADGAEVAFVSFKA